MLSFVLLLEILEALSVAARHLSRRERQVWSARERKAFLPEEGGAAQAVTEGAARGQVRIKAP